MIDVSQISEHMEVVGSDGQHVGTVDKLCLKLTKKDAVARGKHHIISLDAVASLQDGKVMLSMPAQQAMAEEKALPE